MEMSLSNTTNDVNIKNVLLECINKNERDISSYLHLSDILSEEKKYDKAILILDKAIKIFSSSKNVIEHKNLLEHKLGILLDSGSHDEARHLIDTLIKFEKVSAYTYNNLGFLLSIEGKHKEAIESYKKALEIDGSDSSSMVNMAISYKAIYEYDKAIEMLESANKLTPSKPIKYLLDSVIKNKEQAKFSYETLVELLASPNKFHLLIPKNFNASIKNNILNIESEDNKILIMISYNKTKHDSNKKIEETFNTYTKECGDLYSIVMPLNIVERSLYKDKLSKSLFVSKVNNATIFNAFGLVSKNDETLIITISSSLSISSKLIDFANIVINSLYFRDNI